MGCDCLWGCVFPGECLPRGVSTWGVTDYGGVSAQGGCLTRGCLTKGDPPGVHHP